MITVKQFLDIISKSERLSHSNNVTPGEKSALNVIQTLLDETDVSAPPVGFTMIEVILERVKLMVGVPTLHRLAERAYTIEGNFEMMPHKFLKIVKYIDQIARLPDVTGEEIATIMIISNVLRNKTEQTTIDDVIKEVRTKVDVEKLIAIYDRAYELDLNFNQDLPAVQENIDPMPVVMGDNFEKLPTEEKKRRVELLAEGLANTKEQEINLNKTIGTLLDPEKLGELGKYPQEYHASMQLPFSRNTLFLKVIPNGRIFYRFKEDMDWLIWDGSKHAISVIKTGSFAVFTLWQREEEMSIINTFISTTYRGANFYFKNING